MWKDNIVGQKATFDQLQDAIRADTLSHAIILEGKSGHGGLPIALALAERLLCNTPTSSGSCGGCKSCHQMAQLIHPDLHLAFPVVRKEGTERKNTTAKDFMSEWREMILENPYLSYNEWIRSIAKTSANGDINVKECNEIIQQLNLQSFAGGNKVQIVWIADELGSNGNKLLKIIEEPPPNTYIILVCDQITRILTTIISRCRVIRIPRIMDEDMLPALQQLTNQQEQKVSQIVSLADGDFGVALDYLQIEQNNLLDICLQWTQIALSLDLVAVRKWATEFSRYNSEEQKAILSFYAKMLQSLVHFHYIGEQSMRMSEEDRIRILRVQELRSLDIDQLQKLGDHLSQMITKIDRYVNSRMVMFNACLHFHAVFKRINVGLAAHDIL